MRSRDPAPPIRADLAPASTLVSTVLTTCAISALLPQLIVLVTGLRISGVEMDSTTNSGCLCSFLSVTWTMTGLIDLNSIIRDFDCVFMGDISALRKLKIIY